MPKTNTLAPNAATDARPMVQFTDDVSVKNELYRLICNGALGPNVYTRQGVLTELVPVSPDQQIDADENTLGYRLEPITPDKLTDLVSEHICLHQELKNRQGAVTGIREKLLSQRMANIILTKNDWGRLKPIRGVVGAPVVRRDGTLFQAPYSYDARTHLYYAPLFDAGEIPTERDATAVKQAKAVLFDRVLTDFEWKSEGDLANFVALLVSPVLLPYIGGTLPLGAISATNPGSGKTLLANVITRLYGSSDQAWPGVNEELEKTIMATLSQSAPVIVFDNVGDRDVVNSPNLAMLLTKRQKEGRILGMTKLAQLTNDRLWLLTGNKIQFGGDIPQRTVLVELEPKSARPDLRTGFKIPDLDAWLQDPDHRAELLWAVLILVTDWLSAGAPLDRKRQMRTFTKWAQNVGGFLAHHGLTGFMDNTTALDVLDSEQQEEVAFLNTWRTLYGERHMTAAQLVDSYEKNPEAWLGTFPVNSNGKATPKGLGRRLAHREGRFFGSFVVRSAKDKHTKINGFWVEDSSDPVQEMI